MNKVQVEVEVPVLIRNSESDFKERLQAMDVFFADSLTLIKTLVRKNFPSCKILMEPFPRRTNHPCTL